MYFRILPTLPNISPSNRQPDVPLDHLQPTYHQLDIYCIYLHANYRTSSPTYYSPTAPTTSHTYSTYERLSIYQIASAITITVMNRQNELSYCECLSKA